MPKITNFTIDLPPRLLADIEAWAEQRGVDTATAAVELLKIGCEVTPERKHADLARGAGDCRVAQAADGLTVLTLYHRGAFDETHAALAHADFDYPAAFAQLYDCKTLWRSPLR